jgi:hypothetical protein
MSGEAHSLQIFFNRFCFIRYGVVLITAATFQSLIPVFIALVKKM